MPKRRADQRPEDALELSNFRQVPAAGGLSLDRMSAALAGMLDAGDDPYGAAAPAAGAPAEEEIVLAPAADEPECEVTPKSILEALLFVGSPTGEPLASKQVATLMRGVRPAEIDAWVRELNESYAARNCPYAIVTEGAGYRLALRAEFAALRDRFLGRTRQARLSPAAIEVLAAVAYHEPITADDVSRLRGVPSGQVLSQLVRRQLVRLERTDAKPRRVHYYTTPRFLKLFKLENLGELPRGPSAEPT